ncbi:hypothetical protein FQN54_009562 [Arachnomyces sp. PD_36]|nr:hypothetical protein FQN54_009562 [Arachnomyces sp. PD_36]
MSSITDSIPSLDSFFPPTPEAYAFLLNIFQLFPLFTIIQWLTEFHPQGRTSLPSSRLNINGRLAWCAMESVGPLNLIYILTTLPPQLSLPALPFWNKVVASLYLLHYSNRAIISPLFLAPSMSPIHLLIAVFGATFNFLNSSCLGGWLVGMYGVPVAGYQTDGSSSSSTTSALDTLKPYIPYLGLTLFFIGMYGNISSETTLFKLRREEADKRQPATKSSSTTTSPSSSSNKYSKIYIIPPPTGFFTSILYPHYALEWLEWIGFSLVSLSVLSPTPASTYTNLLTTPPTTPPIILAPWYTPLAKLVEKAGLPLPLPAVVFCVNVVAATLPRAVWGRRWYVGKFGEKAVAGRGAVVPFCKYL